MWLWVYFGEQVRPYFESAEVPKLRRQNFHDSYLSYEERLSVKLWCCQMTNDVEKNSFSTFYSRLLFAF